MASFAPPFPVGCYLWVAWRRVWYQTRVEEIREAKHGEPGNIEMLIHVHGEPITKDKWLTVHNDGTAEVGTPPLRLLQVLSTTLTGIGSMPRAGDRVQLLLMDRSLVQLLAAKQSGEDDSNIAEMPTLVGIVAKVLPARDASLVDVAYPTEVAGEVAAEAQWQRVQIGNGYLNVISEARFASLQEQLATAVKRSS